MALSNLFGLNNKKDEAASAACREAFGKTSL